MAVEEYRKTIKEGNVRPMDIAKKYNISFDQLIDGIKTERQEANQLRMEETITSLRRKNNPQRDISVKLEKIIDLLISLNAKVDGLEKYYVSCNGNK